MVRPWVIRPFELRDERAVAAIVSQSWGVDWAGGRYPRYGPAADGEEFLRTIVAESESQVIGFGTMWTAPMHPQTLYGAVGVEAAQEGRGLGRELFDRLLLLRGPKACLQMQTAIWETNERGARFLARNGFVPVRKTWEPILPVTSEVLRSLPRFQRAQAVRVARCTPAGYVIVPLWKLGGDRSRLKVAALCAEVYAAAHEANPPATLSHRAWHDLLFGNPEDPLLEEASFVAVKGDDPVAVALLHPGAEPGVLQLGWRGVAESHRSWSRTLVLALTWEQVFYGMNRGCDLRAEVDSTDPWAMIMHNALPFRRAPAWVTWQRPPDP